VTMVFLQREEQQETMIEYLASAGEQLAKQTAWLEELGRKISTDTESILESLAKQRDKLETHGEAQHRLVAEGLERLQKEIETALNDTKISILRELSQIQSKAEENQNRLEQMIESGTASLTDRLEQNSVRQEKLIERKIDSISNQMYRIEQNMISTTDNAKKGINHSLDDKWKRTKRWIIGTAAVTVLSAVGLCAAIVKWMGTA